MTQADLFAAPAAAAGPKPYAARLMAWERLLAEIKARLVPLGCWGFPDLIRNPHGPWDEWHLPPAQRTLRNVHGLCWPAVYSVRPSPDEPESEPVIFVQFEPGQERNPGLAAAVGALVGAGRIELVPRAGEWDGLERA